MIDITNITKTVTDTLKAAIERQATKHKQEPKNVQIKMFASDKEVSETKYKTLIAFLEVEDVSLSKLLGAINYLTFSTFGIESKISELLKKNIEKHNVDYADFSILIMLNNNEKVQMFAYNQHRLICEIQAEDLLD